MAILDKVLELCDNQDVHLGSTSTAISDNVINLGAANLALGAGTELMLNVRINTAFAVDGATLTTALMTDSDAAIGGGTTIFTTPALAGSALTAGKWILRVSIPHEALEQYIGLKFTIGTSTETAGTVDAWISLDSQSSYGLSVEV
jgi:hypothetical protein